MPGLATSPSTAMLHGRGLKLPASRRFGPSPAPGELVEVVVAGDVVVLVRRLGGAERALLHVGQLGARHLRLGVAGPAAPRPAPTSAAADALDELPPPQVEVLRGDLRRADVGRLLDQHGTIIGLVRQMATCWSRSSCRCWAMPRPRPGCFRRDSRPIRGSKADRGRRSRPEAGRSDKWPPGRPGAAVPARPGRAR